VCVRGLCVYARRTHTISRLLKIISLFCKRALYKRLYSAKETYICCVCTQDVCVSSAGLFCKCAWEWERESVWERCGCKTQDRCQMSCVTRQKLFLKETKQHLSCDTKGNETTSVVWHKRKRNNICRVTQKETKQQHNKQHVSCDTRHLTDVLPWRQDRCLVSYVLLFLKERQMWTTRQMTQDRCCF